MLKKSIKYTTFDDEEVTEEFHFHLNRSDLITMEMSMPGGLKTHLEKIVADQDGAEIMKYMRIIIEKSVGEKSPDGKRFIKNPELVEKFTSSPAYDELFVELCTDANAAGDFINGIIPQGLDNDPQLKAAREGRDVGPPPGFEQQERDPVRDLTDAKARIDTAPGQPEEPLGTEAAGPRRLTRQEVSGMDSAELSHLLATGQAVIGEE